MDLVKEYLASNVNMPPYFCFVGDSAYLELKNDLSALGLSFVHTSGYCKGEDKLPDTDALLEYLLAAHSNVQGKKLVVLGLGEHLALQGKKEAARLLSQLKYLNIGEAKIVLLLRGLAPHVYELKADPRFDQRRFCEIKPADCDLSFIQAVPSVGISALPGFQALLAALESGACGTLAVNSYVNLSQSLFTVRKIASAYEGLTRTATKFHLSRSCGNDTQWAQLLAELNQSGGSLDTVLERHGHGSGLEDNVYVRITGLAYQNWLYFIALKYKAAGLTNGYLRYALEKTNCFEECKTNILNAIIDIPHTDKKYPVFYMERKLLLEKFPESDIAAFVVENRRDISESVYKLTDTTRAEREEIIAWVSQHGMIPWIDDIYPALSAYMKKYYFRCPSLAELLTEYFHSYKLQKLSNQLELAFLAQVEELAQGARKYNLLPTRDVLLEQFSQEDTFLLWLDAFGVEYLAFIEELVRRQGLSVSVQIARAELPTITSINRGFFDLWQGRKEKNSELDETKHADAGGYNFTSNELPIHLAKELDIVAAIINRAATELALRRCKRFLIVSDHGASRLAVLRRKEERYETDTKGEHSGRCCKLFQPYDLPFAAEENGYLVLADYGRFKGSRAANVEVHGGATLEEVVVPIIELKLKSDDTVVRLVKESVIVDFRTGTAIQLFFSAPAKDVSIVLNGKRYAAAQTDAYHYDVRLPDTKRAGEYPAEVYAGDDLIGKVLIQAQGKSGKINDDFDDLF